MVLYRTIALSFLCLTLLIPFYSKVIKSKSNYRILLLMIPLMIGFDLLDTRDEIAIIIGIPLFFLTFLTFGLIIIPLLYLFLQLFKINSLEVKPIIHFPILYSEKVYLILLILMGLGFRISLWATFHNFNVNEPEAIMSSLYLLDGRNPYEFEGSQRGPLEYLLLAPFVFLIDQMNLHSNISEVALVTLCEGLNTIFIFLLGSKLYNKQVGIIASYLYIIHPLIITIDYRIYDDPIAVCFFFAGIYLYFKERYMSSAVFVGLSFGCKFFSILCVPLLAFALLKTKNKKTSIIFVSLFFITTLSIYLPFILWDVQLFLSRVVYYQITRVGDASGRYLYHSIGIHSPLIIGFLFLAFFLSSYILVLQMNNDFDEKVLLSKVVVIMAIFFLSFPIYNLNYFLWFIPLLILQIVSFQNVFMKYYLSKSTRR